MNRCQTTQFKVACPSNIGDMCEWCMIECESIMADKGLIYVVINIGPIAEP